MKPFEFDAGAADEQAEYAAAARKDEQAPDEMSDLEQWALNFIGKHHETVDGEWGCCHCAPFDDDDAIERCEQRDEYLADIDAFRHMLSLHNQHLRTGGGPC